ncbi:MAG: hypothetical protein R2713_03690 [Ilumatobacteraceae bacterium]
MHDPRAPVRRPGPGALDRPGRSDLGRTRRGGRQFGLNPNTFDEAHRQSACPTLRRYPDHAYVVAFSAALTEIDMYLGPGGWSPSVTTTAGRTTGTRTRPSNDSTVEPVTTPRRRCC